MYDNWQDAPIVLRYQIFFLFFLLLPGGIMLLIKRVIDQYGVIELNNQTQMQTRTTDQK